MNTFPPVAAHRRRPLVGAHLSLAGGLTRVLDTARRVGAEAVQVFPANPRRWVCSVPPEPEISVFGEALRRRGIPLFLHTIYLVNLASPDPGLRLRSARALGDALRFGAWAGAVGVVTHVGSHRGEGFAAGLRRVTATVHQAFEQGLGGASGPPILLEVSAGSGDSLGRTPEEMGRLVGALAESGVSAGICLDTAHLFAAGFEVHESEGLERYLADLAEQAGLDAVRLVHLNDSRSRLASRADRHENLWEGQIGRSGLARWVRHPLLASVPFVLEVPGFDGQGPDRRNLRRAKILRGRP